MAKCKREGCPLCAAQMEQPMLQPRLDKNHGNDWCVSGTPRQLRTRFQEVWQATVICALGPKTGFAAHNTPRLGALRNPPRLSLMPPSVVFLQSTHPTRPPLSTCAPSSVSSAHEAWVPFPSQIRVQSPNPVMGNSTHFG